jgi:hypothetical protein
MSYSSGIITAPVSISDVNNVLGAGSTVLSTLCKHANVNRWSKYKPIEYNSAAPDRSGTWYKGTNGHCGWNYASAMVTNPANIKACYSLTNNGWTSEDVPSTYFRLMDFDKYFHNAVPPVSKFYCTAKVSSTGTVDFAAYQGFTSDSSDGKAGSLSFADIGVTYNGSLVSISDMYFGIALYYGTTVRGYITATTKGSLLLQATGTSLGLITGRSYTAYPMLSSVCYSTLTTTYTAGCYIALPEVSPATIECVSAESANNLSFTATATYIYSGSTKTGIKVTIDLKNSGTSDLTLSTNYIDFRFTESAESASIVSGEYKYSIGSFTVAKSGGTKNITYTYSSGFNSAKDYQVIISLGSGLYKRYLAVMMTAS